MVKNDKNVSKSLETGSNHPKMVCKVAAHVPLGQSRNVGNGHTDCMTQGVYRGYPTVGI